MCSLPPKSSVDSLSRKITQCGGNVSIVKFWANDVNNNNLADSNNDHFTCLLVYCVTYSHVVCSGQRPTLHPSFTEILSVVSV